MPARLLIRDLAFADGTSPLGESHAGRIAPGGPADFVLVHGDPLSDPAACWRVWAVFQRGVRVA